MNIKTTVVCLPVHKLDKTLAFYQNALGFSDAKVDEGIITLELPNLSLFLMEKGAFKTYSKKAVRGVQFPDKNAGNKAAMDRTSGGYTGYFLDPDGHLWELVYPQQK